MADTSQTAVLTDFTLFYEELPSLQKSVKRLSRRTTAIR